MSNRRGHNPTPAPTPTPVPTPVASSVGMADAFVSSIGVNTQIDYTNTVYYTNWPAIWTLLQASGIRNVRDGLNDDGAWYYERLSSIIAAGISLDLVSTPGQTSAWVSGFSKLVPGILSIEGANEWDANGGTGWVAADIAWQELVFKAVNKTLPVLGPSLASSASYPLLGSGALPYQNYGNLHMYFDNYNPGNTGYGDAFAPYGTFGTMSFWLNLVKSISGTQPIIITETGYDQEAGFIDAATVAKYLVRTLLMTWNAGVSKTFIYEFADEGGSAGNFGLVTASAAPKPAYVAIKSLIAALADPGATFATTPLSYTISGASTMQSTLLQKRNGTYILAIWNEVPSWNTSTNVEIVVPPQTVTLTFTKAPTSISALAFNAAGNLVASPVSATHSLAITDTVTLVTITP
jgi:hypothetical protein